MDEEKDQARRELESRYDTVGWGLLFLLLGVLALPSGTAEYVGAAAVGAAMLALNLIRTATAVPVSWFSIVLGAALLAAGSGATVGLHMDVFVLFFSLAGLATIAGAVFQPRRRPAQ
jgi:hypothetical protein